MSHRGWALVVLSALVCASCGSRNKPIRVGSKNFTEQVVLGEIIAQHLEHRLGQTVDRKLNLGGTLLTHQALIEGDIDVYPEYTGTALLAVLKEQPFGDAQVVFNRVRSVYANNWKVDVLDPLGFDNPFAMVVRAADAQRLNLKTLSDAVKSGQSWDLGVGYEFAEREDGLPALTREYELSFHGAPKTMDLGLLYQALDQNKVGMVAANATDGQLATGKFSILEDDKKVFPSYQACLAVNGGLYLRSPASRQALAELSGKIDRVTMQRMNYQVDGQHQSPRDVAAAFLKQAGL